MLGKPFLMKSLLLSLIIALGASNVSFAGGGVNEKLQEKKAEFSARAPEEKKRDYEDGIKLVRESGVLERALNVGDEAPNFKLPNASGDLVNLYDVLNHGPVVLIWYRGEWCPYCNIYLYELQKQADKFSALGATIIAISPAQADHAWSAEDKSTLKLQVLSDLGSVVADEYGILYKLPPKIAAYYQDAFDLKSVNADDGTKLPLSASYVIGQDRVISYAYLNADYRERAEINDLLHAVTRLKN